MEYQEFRVPKPIIDTIMNMDMSLVLKKWFGSLIFF
jgi:hypothetical protein